MGELLSSAQLAEALGNYGETLKLCDQALTLSESNPFDRARLWLLRGRANYFLGKMEAAIVDWTQVVELSGAPVEQIAQALYNRGVTWGQKGESDKALADYTRVIEELPGAPVEQIAQALNNRGVTWGQKGESDKELADYTRVIEELPGAPVEQIAQALNNRGVTWGQKGESDKALADYTRVIEELPGAPVEQIARGAITTAGLHGVRKARATRNWPTTRG